LINSLDLCGVQQRILQIIF